MEFLVGPIDNKEITDSQPEYVKRILNSPTAVTFLAKDGEKTVGVAVYDKCLSRNDFMTFRYIYVLEDYRRRRVATKLVGYAESRIKEKGITGIYAKVANFDKEHVEGNILLVRLRYIPLLVDGHYISYFVQDLRECVFAQKLKQMEAILEHVKFRREISKISLREFSRKLSLSNKDIDFENIDLLFSSFYVEGDEVKGYLHLDEIEENVLLLADSYIEDGKGMVLAAMLANALKVSMATLPDDAMVCLQVYKENEYRGVRTVFGEPENDATSHEYVKLL